MPPGAPTLVISDAGLASTVAALLEAERCPPMLWVPPSSAGLMPPIGHDHEAVLEAARRQSDLQGFAGVIDAGAAGSSLTGVGRLSRPIALLEALRAAMEHACARIVWPVACGSDLDEISTCAERALLVTRLAWLEEGSLTGPAPEIDTPLIDLTTRALHEMARDLDTPEGSWLQQVATQFV